MKQRIFIVAAGVILILGLASCEMPDFPAAPVQPPASETSSAPEESEPVREVTIKTIIPESVRERWGSVELQLTNRETGKVKTLTIATGTNHYLPETDIRISVSDFLPDYRMDGLTITSRSNKALNPAVNISVYEGEKKLFNGWIFSAHPSINRLQHDKYGLKLLKGIRRPGK